MKCKYCKSDSRNCMPLNYFDRRQVLCTRIQFSGKVSCGRPKPDLNTEQP
uniref:Uncharacterized protein n=1 Tax=Anguilla anguilla TaxID=7936 RepID=A0A0E9V4S4_ANGAN